MMIWPSSQLKEAGASVMGAVFAYGAGTADFINADPAAITAGMRFAFLLWAARYGSEVND